MAGTNATAYAYNLDKQITLITRPGGETVGFGYDAGGRLSAITTPRGQAGYAYDSTTGNLSSITAPDGGSLLYTYDGFLVKRETVAGAVSGAVDFTYDNDLRLTNITANGVAAGFSYDSDGLLTRVGSLNITRDPQTGLITGTSRNSITSAISYNSFGEVSGLTAAYAGSSLFTASYTRDKLGRITTKTETAGGATSTYAYTYDSAGRLTDVTKDGVNTGHYDYDSNSNRLTYSGQLGSFTGNYDAQDRLTQYGNFTYTYTANGDLQSKTNTSTGQTTAYNYDALGNLISATLPDGAAVEYVIDGRNRRVGKKVNGVLVQGFLYANQLNPVYEMDGGGNYVARYMYGTRANVPDYMARPDGVYRIFSDHLGSVHLVVNADTGAVVQRIDYDEFGNVINDTNPGFQPFGFAGGLYDQHTKLTRFGARDYDAETGRWTAKDPIGFAGGDTNLYGYVLGDPVNLVDPWGLVLTDEQIANIIFNETRSFSGNNVNLARKYIAHTIINGDEALGENRPLTAPTTANVPANEQEIYQACTDAVAAARAARSQENDPTNGAMNFNFRNNNSTAPFWRLPLRTQVGPLNNSYTGGGLNRTGVYSNTYGR